MWRELLYAIAAFLAAICVMAGGVVSNRLRIPGETETGTEGLKSSELTA